MIPYIIVCSMILLLVTSHTAVIPPLKYDHIVINDKTLSCDKLKHALKKAHPFQEFHWTYCEPPRRK